MGEKNLGGECLQNLGRKSNCHADCFWNLDSVQNC